MGSTLAPAKTLFFELIDPIFDLSHRDENSSHNLKILHKLRAADHKFFIKKRIILFRR